MKFSELGIHDDLLDAISYMGFKEATPIQEQAVPIILDGKDLIADLPGGTTSILIIVPTRELAIQIDQQVQGIVHQGY